MKIKLKRHPQDLPHKLQLLVELRKIPEPKFLKALKLYPPPPPSTLNVIPKQVGMFDAKNGSKYTFKTSEIKYDEDELRDLFYKQHPMEKRRPITFTGDSIVTWDTITGTPVQELRGENVIQRTLFLLREMEISRAYKQALKEFYRNRELEESKLNTNLCEEFLRKEEAYLATLEQ